MRKAVIFSVCILLAASSHAQLSLTPEAGYNRSVFFTNATNNQVITSPVNGFQVGVLVTKSWKDTKIFLDHVFVQTGLQFAQKGSFQGRGYQSVYGSNNNVQLSYLQAPLNLGIHADIYHGLSVMVSGGLYAAYGISGTDKGSSQDISGTSNFNRKVTFTNDQTVSDDSKTFIKPLDTGYDFSAGLAYKNIEVKTTYSSGFGNVSPVGTTLYKNEVWNFSVGYSFSIK